MPEVSSNNPAGRLYRLLEIGRKQDKNKQIGEIWSVLLDVPKGDSALLLRRLGQVISLPDAIRSEILNQPDVSHSIYLQYLPRMEKALMMLNLTSSWKSFIDRVDEASMVNLQFCDELLARSSPNAVIDVKNLGDLYTEAKELLEDIKAADIEEYLRSFLLEQVRRICQAIEEFKVSGAAPLQTAVASAVGSAVLDYRLAAQAHASASSISSRFWEFLNRVAIVITLVTVAPQLPERVMSMIPPSSTEASKSSEELSPPMRGILQDEDEEQHLGKG